MELEPLVSVKASVMKMLGQERYTYIPKSVFGVEHLIVCRFLTESEKIQLDKWNVNHNESFEQVQGRDGMYEDKLCTVVHTDIPLSRFMEVK